MCARLLRVRQLCRDVLFIYCFCMWCMTSYVCRDEVCYYAFYGQVRYLGNDLCPATINAGKFAPTQRSSKEPRNKLRGSPARGWHANPFVLSCCPPLSKVRIKVLLQPCTFQINLTKYRQLCTRTCFVPSELQTLLIFISFLPNNWHHSL